MEDCGERNTLRTDDTAFSCGFELQSENPTGILVGPYRLLYVRCAIVRALLHVGINMRMNLSQSHMCAVLIARSLSVLP